MASRKPPATDPNAAILADIEQGISAAVGEMRSEVARGMCNVEAAAIRIESTLEIARARREREEHRASRLGDHRIAWIALVILGGAVAIALFRSAYSVGLGASLPPDVHAPSPQVTNNVERPTWLWINGVWIYIQPTTATAAPAATPAGP